MIAITVVNCSPTKTIKFSQRADEIVKTDALKEYLTNNKNPKVVLRVPDSRIGVTEAEKNEESQSDDKDYLYNAIENQLLISGFIVRDRQLFSQIINNNENNIDYAQLKDKSDTDLIIELTKLDNNILYETNKYYDQNNKEKVESKDHYKSYGATVEFKIVLIKSNEFAGVYRFNYTPCVEGCVVSGIVRDKNSISRYSKKPSPYEGVELYVMEEFLKKATVQLVYEMRK